MLHCTFTIYYAFPCMEVQVRISAKTACCPIPSVASLGSIPLNYNSVINVVTDLNVKEY